MEVAKDDKKKAKSSVDASMNAFVLSLEERSRIAQAKFLLYSPGHQSKAVLTNPYFRSMLQSCNFGKGEVPILGYKQVASYAEAEFKLMFDLIKLLLSEQEQLAVGNKYLQVIHDGCTAANKRKYQAIGIQFVDPRWRRNHVIDSILSEWIKYARSIDWRKEFGDELKDSLNDGEAIDVVDHLLPLNIGKLYVKAHRMNKFGYLPSMASSSSGQLGALMAESYCERIISVGNMISTDRNVLLNDDELEMLVVLKMNKEFIEFMRNNYAHEIKKKFGQRFNESSTSGP